MVGQHRQLCDNYFFVGNEIMSCNLGFYILVIGGYNIQNLPTNKSISINFVNDYCHMVSSLYPIRTQCTTSQFIKTFIFSNFHDNKLQKTPFLDFCMKKALKFFVPSLWLVFVTFSPIVIVCISLNLSFFIMNIHNFSFKYK